MAAPPRFHFSKFEHVDESYKINIRKRIDAFRSSDDDKLVFPPTLSSTERKYVHSLAEQFGLTSKSFGGGSNRYLTLSKRQMTAVEGDMELEVNPAAMRRLNDIFSAEPVRPEEREAVTRRATSSSAASATIPARNSSRSSNGGQTRSETPGKTKQNSKSTKNDGDPARRRRVAVDAHVLPTEAPIPATSSAPSPIGAVNAHKPRPSTPPALMKQRRTLPIWSHRDEILRAIRENDVTIISGETGSGKSTQVVQYLLEEDFVGRRVVCTQPRRLSAISLAERVAEEMGENSVGETVGYAVRLESARCPDTRVLFCTTGIVLSGLKEGIANSDSLRGATHLIIDEIHERDRNADFLLIISRILLSRRWPLKVVLMSATLSVEKFTGYFRQQSGLRVGCVAVEGSLFPVKQIFLERILDETRYVERFLSIPHSLPPSSSSTASAHHHHAPQKMTCQLCGLSSFRDAAAFGIHAASCSGTLGVAAETFEFGGNDALNRSSVLVEEIDPWGADDDEEEEQEETGGGGGVKLQNGDDDLDAVEAARTVFAKLHTDNNVDVDQNRGGVEEEDDAWGRDPNVLRTYNNHRQSTGDESEVDLQMVICVLELIQRNPIEHFTGGLPAGGRGSMIKDDAASAVLIFLPGWAEIGKLCDMLGEHPVFGNQERFLVLPLHSGVPSREQRKVFARPPGKHCRKIIVSTNIAETSLTIEDVVYVIDSGLAKEKGYDPVSKMSSLLPTFITRANAVQRKGRAGRCRVGVCFHLYSRARYMGMAPGALPEIQRTPLEDLCLHARGVMSSSSSSSSTSSFDLPTIADFLALAPDPPPSQTVMNAVEALMGLGALDAHERLTPLGHALMRLPVEPRVGKMLLLGVFMRCASHALTLAVANGFRDPFVLPMTPFEKARANDVKRRFSRAFPGFTESSDHVAVLHAHAEFSRVRREGGEAGGRRWAAASFLSYNALETLDGMRRQVAVHVPNLISRGHALDAPINNSNSASAAVLGALVVAATFPNVALLPPRNGRRGPPQSLVCATERKVRPHASSSLRLFVGRGSPAEEADEEDRRAAIAGDTHRYFVFEELIRGTANCAMRGCTEVGPLTLCLFGGFLDFATRPTPKAKERGEEEEEEEEEDDDDDFAVLVGGEGGSDVRVRINRWIKLKPRDLATAERLAVLRLRFERAFLESMRVGRIVPHAQLAADRLVEVLNAQVYGEGGAGASSRGGGGHVATRGGNAPTMHTTTHIAGRGRGRGRGGSVTSMRPLSVVNPPPAPPTPAHQNGRGGGGQTARGGTGRVAVSVAKRG